MNKFSISIIAAPESASKVRKVLSIFVHHSEVLEGQLDSHLTELLPNETYLNETRVVGYCECIAKVKSWLKTESAIGSRLESATEDFQKNAKSIYFDEVSGGFVSIKLNGDADPNAILTIENEKRTRLADMFSKSGAFMSSNSGFHYVKPSGKHVSGFLRTSNVLEAGENVSSIAFWLLPYLWKKQIRHIIVDTSGITSIAYVLAYEALKRGGLEALPTISSHKSYGGLDSLIVVDPEHTLFLISASTSGGLVEKLIAKGAKLDNIVTLFYLGESLSNSGHILCNLTWHETENP
ncbi:MAG: hypothetical protein Q7U42_10055, partial [Parvibaculum sp.]|nr:hypothetical protein [Parvibaculum sp.]